MASPSLTLVKSILSKPAAFITFPSSSFSTYAEKDFPINVAVIIGASLSTVITNVWSFCGNDSYQTLILKATSLLIVKTWLVSAYE